VTDLLVRAGRPESRLRPGLNYLLLGNSLAWTASISGPLLAWIGATGIWLTRSSSAEAPARRHDPGRPAGQSHDQPSGP
jgi:hypothetical protein